jgi:two-component system chemotaxis response regulator CheY
MKILLVDDSKMMRGVQRKMLEKLGAEFFEANDGAEALMIHKQQGSHFDLIVADWNMPNMDGITMVRAIRTVDRVSPILMCTTESEKTSVMEALRAGVNNYVVKPFAPEVFAQKVVQTMQKKAA